MTLITPTGSRSRDPGRLLAQVQALVGPVEAAMLYGSEARGSAGPRSDVDVLVLIRQHPRTVVLGDLTVSAYLPSHLRALAERGSLFVLHLRHDGVVLHDPTSRLADVLSAFAPPANPELVSAELAVAAGGLLAATTVERTELGAAMHGLAYYLLRSAVYDACARNGRPQFDCGTALQQLGLARLAPLIAERRLPHTAERLERVLAALPAALPGCAQRRAPGLVATSVAVAVDWPLASDLLAGVVAGQGVDYTALTLPPF